MNRRKAVFSISVDTAWYNLPMKKTLVGLALLALLLPAAASAAEVKLEEAYYLQKGETLNTNLYFAGEGAFIFGDARGDIVAVGGKINIEGTVSGDVLVAGGNIDIGGTVNNDVRVAGGNITIKGTISGDLVVAGGQIFILPGTVINGDLLLGGGMVKMDGMVNGNIRSGAGQMVINGEVRGNVDVASDDLALGDKAVIGGNFVYRSTHEAKISPSAVIRGETTFDKRGEGGRNIARGFFGGFAILSFLMTLAAALFFGLVFKKVSGAVVHASMHDVWRNLGRGFVFLVVTPILAVVLFVTIIGVPLGILTLLGYAFLLLLSCVFAAITAGAWLEKWIWKRDTITWRTILLGAFVYMLLGWIPFVGWIAKAILFLVSFGALGAYMRREWLENRA